MTSYRPLGSYSPSLQPSIQEPEPIAHDDHFELDGYGQSKLSRPTTPQGHDDYDNYRYNNVSQDIESRFLIKDEQRPQEFRLYKRRFYGLAHLTLLSFAIGWGYAAPSVVATTAKDWYGISFATLNYLSIAGSLVFIVPAPFVIWILNRSGPKWGIVIASVFMILGNWIIYAGAATHNFKVNIAGTIIHSLAQPFAICAPTRYSRLWFSDRGRTSATAVTSLAYPLGAGFGALTGPFMVKPVGPFNYDIQALIIAIAFTAIGAPSIFLPSKPPTPPSIVASTSTLGLMKSVKSLAKNRIFYLQFIGFAVLAGAIDTEISLTNEAIAPYGYSQESAAFAIAFLIFVGVAASIIVSPILDRTHWHEPALKIFVTLVALGYTGLPFIPETKSVPALYAIYAFIGAFSLSVEPCVLEYQASRTHPVSPEFSSVLCWCGAKVTGAIFTIVSGNLLQAKISEEGQPVGSIFNGLLFIAAMAWLAAVSAWFTNVWIFKREPESKVEGDVP